MGTSEVASEEAAGGGHGEPTGAWREDVALTWSETVPRDMVEWARWPVSIQDLRVVPNGSCVPELMSSWVLAGRLGLVVSSPEALSAYVETNGAADVELPETYSAFPDGHRPIASRTAGGREYSLPSNRVEAALRELNGKGRFEREDYRLIDCSPAPAVLLREGTGAVLIAPTSDES